MYSIAAEDYALQFTSVDPAFVKKTVERVYPLIPATATSPEMPETRAFSRQLVAYIAAFLPAAPYFKSNDARIAATGGAGSGARAATPGRPQAPTASDDEEGSELITGVVDGAGEQAGSPIVAVLTSQPGEGVGTA